MTLRAQVPGDDFGGEPPRLPRDEAEERAWVLAAHEASRSQIENGEYLTLEQWRAQRRLASSAAR